MDGNNANNTREFGKIFETIPLKLDAEILIKNEAPKIIEKRGVIIITFPLDKRSNGGSFKVSEEDEI